MSLLRDVRRGNEPQAREGGGYQGREAGSALMPTSVKWKSRGGSWWDMQKNWTHEGHIRGVCVPWDPPFSSSDVGQTSHQKASFVFAHVHRLGLVI